MSNSMLVRCTQCACQVRLNRFQKHIEKVHQEPKKIESKVKTTTPKPEVSLEQCPKCHSKVRQDRLQKHLKKHSEQSEILNQKGKSELSTDNIKNPLQKCPECHYKIRMDGLFQHLEKVHGISTLNFLRKRAPIQI
jgi:hypothetical protein